MAAEAQALVTGSGTAEWVCLMMAEALDGGFDLRAVPEVLQRRPPVAITDCKSLYDHVTSLSSPSKLDDRRCAIDVAIIRQSAQRSKMTLRWCPTDRQLADALTKDAGGPADLLRACLRVGSYQLSPEETMLELKAQEKQRRLDRGQNRRNKASQKGQSPSSR